MNLKRHCINKQTNLRITLKNSLERSRNDSLHLVSKEKNQGEQFKAENIKTLGSHKLSMRLFLCGLLSQVHWGCEASSESSHSPCGRLKGNVGDLKQPLVLAQELVQEEELRDTGQQN